MLLKVQKDLCATQYIPTQKDISKTGYIHIQFWRQYFTHTPFIFYTSITHMLPDLLQYNLQPCPLLRLSVLHSKNNPYFKYTTLDDMKFLKQAYMNSQGKETITELNSLEPLLGKHDVDPLNLCPFNLKG